MTAALGGITERQTHDDAVSLRSAQRPTQKQVYSVEGADAVI